MLKERAFDLRNGFFGNARIVSTNRKKNIGQVKNLNKQLAIIQFFLVTSLNAVISMYYYYSFGINNLHLR